MKILVAGEHHEPTMPCVDGAQEKTGLIGSYPGGNKSCLIPVADKVMDHGSPAQETQATTPGSISASSTVHTAVTVLFQGEVWEGVGGCVSKGWIGPGHDVGRESKECVCVCVNSKCR